MRLRGLVSSTLVNRVCVSNYASGRFVGRRADDMYSRLGLVNRLVGNDEVLKEVTSRIGSLDQLRGKQSVGNLSALTHNRQPLRKLVVVLSVGKGDVVALVADLLHALLVDNGPDKTVESALLVALTELSRAGHSRNGKRLLAVEGIQGGLDGIGRLSVAVPEETNDILGEADERVEALDQGELDIHKGNVDTAGGVGRELEETLLLEDGVTILGVGIGQSLSELITGLVRESPGHAGEANKGKLGVQCRSMGANPLRGLGTVQTGTEEVEDQHDGDGGQNETFGLEFGKAMTLVHIVPLCVGDHGLCGLGTGEGGRYGNDGDGGRVGALCEVGEVWGAKGQSSHSVESHLRVLEAKQRPIDRHYTSSGG